MDTLSLFSLRFTQDFEQTGTDRRKHYEIFPERAVYQEPNKPEQPSVPDPLDDASFIYFLRTVPLEIGATYSFDRYFRPDKNPVRIKVLRRETVKVPAGTYQTHRRSADHQVEGHLLGEQQGRDLVLRGREPHHGAAQGRPAGRVAQPVPNVGATTDALDPDSRIASVTNREADLAAVRTVPIARRPNKVRAEEFASPPAAGDRSFAAFLASLPDVLVARDFLRVIDAVAQAKRAAARRGRHARRSRREDRVSRHC